ncbi:MAG TPA: hypothetical protein VNT60_03040 [Deinococcales bacterium]|nr:hypothetical protein [Deinococcales bacterium]
MDRKDFLEITRRLLEAVEKVPEGSPEELLLLTRASEVVGERLLRAARPPRPNAASFAGGTPDGEADHRA